MYKVIEEIKVDEYIYKIGIKFRKGKRYPSLDIYKDNTDLARIEYTKDCVFFLYLRFLGRENKIEKIKNLFKEIEAYSFIELETMEYKKIIIPKKVKERFEEIFLLYKLNDFNRL